MTPKVMAAAVIKTFVNAAGFKGISVKNLFFNLLQSRLHDLFQQMPS